MRTPARRRYTTWTVFSFIRDDLSDYQLYVDFNVRPIRWKRVGE